MLDENVKRISKIKYFFRKFPNEFSSCWKNLTFQNSFCKRLKGYLTQSQSRERKTFREKERTKLNLLPLTQMKKKNRFVLAYRSQAIALSLSLSLSLCQIHTYTFSFYFWNEIKVFPPSLIFFISLLQKKQIFVLSQKLHFFDWKIALPKTLRRSSYRIDLTCKWYFFSTVKLSLLLQTWLLLVLQRRYNCSCCWWCCCHFTCLLPRISMTLKAHTCMTVLLYKSYSSWEVKIIINDVTDFLCPRPLFLWGM